MLKKISVDHLRTGMYIKEFCGSWMEHPFWRSQFVLDDPNDIQRIRSSSIREVWIDTAKGRDVERPEQGVSESRSEAEVDATLAEAARAQRQTSPSTTREELTRAAAIYAKGRQAVSDMFGEARMGKAVDTVVARKVVEEISDSVTRNAGALISLARLKTADEYTYMHSVAVCALMIALARQLELDEEAVHAAGMAGLMHDLGKALMPMEVLNKPGRLTEEEFAIIKRHPEEGHRMLLQAGSAVDATTLDVCLHHHEKTDGSGYPHGLKDAQISLHAKMGAVCDVYDAITSNRPYKAGWDPAESIRKMAEWTEGHFDQRIFHAFVKSLGIYPVGSLVRLESGKLGVVVEQSRASLLKPIVKVFYSTKSKARIAPKLVDLSHTTCQDAVADREDPTQWNFPDLNELWSDGHAAY